MERQSFYDLKIYREAFDLSLKVHRLSLNLPKFEMYEEGGQIRRSSKSIVSNIVEGFGRRRYKQEFMRFLIYASASCDETRGHLDILFETNSLVDERLYSELRDKYVGLGRMLGAFMRAVELNHKSD